MTYHSPSCPHKEDLSVVAGCITTFPDPKYHREHRHSEAPSLRLNDPHSRLDFVLLVLTNVDLSSSFFQWSVVAQPTKAAVKDS